MRMEKATCTHSFPHRREAKTLQPACQTNARRSEWHLYLRALQPGVAVVKAQAQHTVSASRVLPRLGARAAADQLISRGHYRHPPYPPPWRVRDTAQPALRGLRITLRGVCSSKRQTRWKVRSERTSILGGYAVNTELHIVRLDLPLP